MLVHFSILTVPSSGATLYFKVQVFHLTRR